MDGKPTGKLKDGKQDSFERQSEAVHLRCLGYSYDQIAEKLHYVNRSGAWKAVQAVLKASRIEAAEEAVKLELLRLNALFEVYYAKALKGDLAAAELCLTLMRRMAQLLGAEPAAKTVNEFRGPGGGPIQTEIAVKGEVHVDATFIADVLGILEQADGTDCQGEVLEAEPVPAALPVP